MDEQEDDLPIGWWCNRDTGEMIHATGLEGWCAIVQPATKRYVWSVKAAGVEVARGLVQGQDNAIICAMTALLVVLAREASETREECSSSIWLESINSTAKDLAAFYGSDQNFLNTSKY